MKRVWTLAAMVLAASAWTVDLSAQQAQQAQQPGQGGQQRQGTNNNNNRQGGRGNRGKPDEEFKLPDDKRLLEVHRKFVLDAEKLAKEYERDNQIEKARTCYAEILRLIPTYPSAKEAMDKLYEKQSGAETKKVLIHSTKGWHDTGVVIEEGKPFRVRTDGKWTFRLTTETSADGVEIPEELKEFNLGALVGYIDDGKAKEIKPFLVGSSFEGKAEKSGKLFLGMYDADGSDNAGQLNVVITGTFYHPNGSASR